MSTPYKDNSYKGKPIPKNLMTWIAFRTMKMNKVRDFIIEKEKRTPTYDEVEFKVSCDYKKYLERNMNPKQAAFSAASGTLEGGQRLGAPRILPNLAEVVKPVIMEVESEDARHLKVDRNMPAKQLQILPKKPDHFEQISQAFLQSCASVAPEVSPAAFAVLVSEEERSQNLIGDIGLNESLPIGTLIGPFLLQYNLQKLGSDKIQDILEFNSRVAQIYEDAFVLGVSHIGILNHTGLYYLLASLTSKFLTEDKLFRDFEVFFQSLSASMDEKIEIDNEFLLENAAEIKRNLNFMAQLSAEVIKNPRFTHSCIIDLLAKVLSIKISARGIGDMYVKLQLSANQSAVTEKDRVEKTSSRLVLRSIATCCDQSLYVKFAVRQIACANIQVLLVPKNHVLVILNDKGGPLATTLMQQNLDLIRG